MQANPALVTSRLGGLTRTTLALVGAVVLLVLGGAAGYVARGLTLPTAAVPTHSSVHALAGAGGPAVGYTTRRSGTQTLEGPASTGTSSAASREPGNGRTGPQLIQEGRS